MTARDADCVRAVVCPRCKRLTPWRRWHRCSPPHPDGSLAGGEGLSQGPPTPGQGQRNDGDVSP